MVLVINEATCSQCGRPSANCSCFAAVANRQPPLTDVLEPPSIDWQEMTANSVKDSISQTVEEQERLDEESRRRLQEAVEEVDKKNKEDALWLQHREEENRAAMGLPRYGDVFTPPQLFTTNVIQGRGEVLENIVPTFGGDDDEPEFSSGNVGECLSMPTPTWD